MNEYACGTSAEGKMAGKLKYLEKICLPFYTPQIPQGFSSDLN